MGINESLEKNNQKLTELLTRYEKKEIDRSQLMEFIESENFKVETLITYIKEFVHSSTEVTKKYMDIIDKSIGIFEKNLDSAKTEEERKEIRDDIIKLIDKASLESDKNKNFTLTIIVLVVGLVTGSTTLLLKNGLKNIKPSQLLRLLK